ncbi:DUF523 domain-containing protein [Legionella lytica]|uniref:DUF523 domain-containing protein n=1 Tax=Legionella lytica TaxID=96232 RepID=A0ABY4YC29_9GAMM|nr:DUF523 domain-containing protein [Legionella lytica]
MEKVLISGCLVGLKVRYHGGDAPCHSQIIDRWAKEGRIVSICPEVSAGLPIPRPSSEIIYGTANDVLRGKAKVSTHKGIDRTDAFIKGAFNALSLAKKFNIKIAVLKKDSPSCGNTTVYDGSFSGKIIPGSGVTAQLLNDNGIKVFNELELHEADMYMRSLAISGSCYFT